MDPQKHLQPGRGAAIHRVHEGKPVGAGEPWLECSLLGSISPLCQSYGNSETEKAVVVPIIPPAVYQVQARRGGLAKTVSGVSSCSSVSCSSLGGNELQSQLQINDPSPLPPVAGSVRIVPASTTVSDSSSFPGSCLCLWVERPLQAAAGSSGPRADRPAAEHPRDGLAAKHL